MSGSLHCSFQCWGCCDQSEKRLNLSSVMTLISNCQSTINNQMDASYNRLKCRDKDANIEHLSREFRGYCQLSFLRLDILLLVLMKEVLKTLLCTVNYSSMAGRNICSFLIQRITLKNFCRASPPDPIRDSSLRSQLSYPLRLYPGSAPDQ